MSHLFLRLAASVRPSTEPKLRPLVGSVYMPAYSSSPVSPPDFLYAPHPAGVQAHSSSEATDGFTLSEVAALTPDQTSVSGESHRIDRPGSALLPPRAPDATPEQRSRVPHQPLLSTAQSVRSNQLLIQPHRNASESFSSALTNLAAKSARSAASSLREPDEIFIHIGRVEVAAVSQPAVRPAPAQQRKSINLSEYLRRGNGGTR